MVGWLYWGFTSLQRYFSQIATWKHEITISEIVVARPGIEPRSPYPAGQELNQYTTAAPQNTYIIIIVLLFSVEVTTRITLSTELPVCKTVDIDMYESMTGG